MIQLIPKYVINLDSRKDRLSRFTEELPKLFESNTFCRISATPGSDTRVAIIASHKTALAIALKNIRNTFESFGFLPEWVLVMEDDLVLSNSTQLKSFVDECMKNIPNDAEILVGGIYGGLQQYENPWWNRVCNFAGAHFVIYHRSVLEKIVHHDFGQFHYDRGLSTVCKCYVTAKMFATQSEGFSDQRGLHVDDSHYLVGYNIL